MYKFDYNVLTYNICTALTQLESSNVNCRPVIEMTIPSSKDPTLAPEGHHVVQLFTMYTPYSLSGGRQWDEMTRNQYADCGKHTHNS